MRVLLIRPPAKHTVESEVPEAVSAENLSYPPLALMAIATFAGSLRSYFTGPCRATLPMALPSFLRTTWATSKL